nr:hypothetical protein [Hydrococcus sp. Prado102]
MPKFIPYFERNHLLRERLIASIAIINLVLVFFNLSYLYGRDFYLQTIPSLVQLYDPIKGIKPQPETENYLERIEATEAKIAAEGLRSQTVESELANLRQLSLQIIEDNPFAVANKSSTLEKIKNEIRQRTGKIDAREAFNTFWSQDYLQNAGWQEELAFWNLQIRPFIQTNYYREIGRFGSFIDRFWLLDLPFILIFAIDFWTRILSIKRRHRELSWTETILRRWYDIFLLLPFWRAWRVLPVAIRLYHVNWFDLEPVRAEIHRDILIGLTAELTEMVGIEVIEQMQLSIQNGKALRDLLEFNVPANDNNEVNAIATRVINVSVYDVLPQVQADIENLLHHSINRTLTQLPAYQHLKHIPGLNNLPNQLTENLAKSLSDLAYDNLTNLIEDPVAAEITSRLGHNFRDALKRELFSDRNIREIKFLLINLLEEIKINTMIEEEQKLLSAN